MSKINAKRYVYEQIINRTHPFISKISTLEIKFFFVKSISSKNIQFKIWRLFS